MKNPEKPVVLAKATSILLSLIVATLFLSTSCCRKNPETPQVRQTVCLSLDLKNPLRTSIAEESNGTLHFTWEKDDKIALLLEQGAIKHMLSLTPKSIDNARAVLEFDLPKDINPNNEYKVYGMVHASFDATPSPVVLLPAPSLSVEEYASLKTKVLMSFSQNNATGLSLSATVHHVGSIFCTQIDNQSYLPIKVSNISLSGTQKWVYAQSFRYDIAQSKGVDEGQSSVAVTDNSIWEIPAKTKAYRYVWLAPAGSFSTTGMVVSGMFNGTSKSVALKEGVTLEPGKRFNVRIVYNDTASVDASITIPDMPAIDLF